MIKSIAQLEKDVQDYTEQMKEYDWRSKKYRSLKQMKYSVRKRLAKRREQIRLVEQLIGFGKVQKRLTKNTPLEDVVATYAYDIKQRMEYVETHNSLTGGYMRLNMRIRSRREILAKRLMGRIDDLAERVLFLEDLYK